MKVVAITGAKECALIEKPDPKIKDDFVKVKIVVAPMCTEYKAYLGGNRSDCLGHEAAGEVVEVARPGRVKVGDRVVVMPQYPCGKCDLCVTGDYIHCEHCVDPLAACGSQTGVATYAQYCIKPDWLLLPIPEGMSYEHAAMTCCGLGPSFGAAQRLGMGIGDTVLIAGLGPVGLGGIINCVKRGATVIGLDSQPYRSRLARELGAKTVISPTDPDALAQVKALTGGRGVDMAIDCTGNPQAQKFCVEAARRRGQVAFIGWGGHLELGNMIPQGLTLHGVWHWRLPDAPQFMRLVADAAPLLDKLITHRFPMSRVKEGFELQATGDCGKVLLDPWQ